MADRTYMAKITLLEKIFLGISLSIITLAVLLVGYWLLWPETVITFTNPQSLSVDKKFYYPGDRIAYTVKYCKYKNITATVSRAIVDDYRVTFTDVQSNLPMGCHTMTANDLTIPMFFTQGTYHLTISGLYPLNSLRNFTTPLLRTVDFQVLNSQVLGAKK